ncbi:MAG: ATP phosphoribosyltransferase [Alphaproteobacteria bacterium]|nr:ATP phosphoribosyltransferase [Alphaproteobacteria bacterium]
MREGGVEAGERIRMAVQKSGRMAEDSIGLLKNCGLHVDRSKDQLFCRIKELPIDLLLVRDDDIPGFVADGICDIGIVGENVFAETQSGGGAGGAIILERLGFSRCRLSIAVPENGGIDGVAALNGKAVATSYPHLLQAFLKTNNVAARILMMTGSVEVAPRLKIADGICDIVASGATLTANGLRELTVVLPSEALLIRAAQALSPDKEKTVQRLLARMRGALLAADSKYIMLNAPRAAVERITALLPGCDAPTIMDLNRHDMVAIHAVCKETVFWETMEKLQEAGASAILVLPIEKMTA